MLINRNYISFERRLLISFSLEPIVVVGVCVMGVVWGGLFVFFVRREVGEGGGMGYK